MSMAAASEDSFALLVCRQAMRRPEGLSLLIETPISDL
jgi:hypothetical protein